MPPKRSGAKKTSHVRPTTTSKAQAAAPLKPAQSTPVAEPPEPVPETEGQEMASTLAPSPTHHKLLLPTQRLERITPCVEK